MQTKQKTTGLVWFGNDLRIQDNEVLSEAIRQHDQVIGIYCLNPKLLQKTNFGFRKLGVYRAKFLLESLEDLKHNLAQKNISLLVYVNAPEERIPEICETYQVACIYKQEEWTSEEIAEKQRVASKLENIPIVELYNQFLYHPEDILSDPQKIPNVFSNFRKKLEKYVAIREEATFDKMFGEENLVENTTVIPSLSDLGFKHIEFDSRTAFPFKGGETSALARLNDYFFTTKKLGFYKKTRNGLVGVDYSSKFSPWLANGSISARTIYWQVKKFEQEYYKNQSTYWLVFELIWRDYFKYISIKYENEIFKLGGILRKDYWWSRDAEQIDRWIDGETQDDFVNANMIELRETGWMSNRGRQNVASYFAKELELDWRIGAAYFEEYLIDYDVHSNYGNWMYVSGVGNDPRDRKFNTQLQAERYDSNGKFRKLWLQNTLF
jgi:deoxyribodipyrimidine photo-lyase